MKALEDEEKFSPTKQSNIPSQRFQERSELNVNATPFVPKELSSPLKSEQPHLPTLGVSTLKNPFGMPPSEPPLMPVKPEAEMNVPPDPCRQFPSEPPCVPVKVEHQSLGPRNPFTPVPCKSEQEKESSGKIENCITDAVERFLVLYPKESSGLIEVTIKENVKLQTKQTKLRALIAEQQPISSLPVQEPPIFSGNYFDYPIFMRAFETIIEACVTADKERLYFLTKYTTGKANDVIKGFVTLSRVQNFRLSWIS